jgi:drug/metabolite transporter (DMT)-like permease
MLLICVIWATNFAVIKKIFDVVPEGALDPSLYVAIRFGIAAAVMLPGLRGTFRNKGLWKNGIIVGLCVFLGYIGQSMGILASTASKTAFFCSMNVVWVALVTGFMRRKFQARTWVSVLLAISGAAFIELKGFEAATVHDLWLLLQPIGFGSGYLFLEQNMKDFPDSAQAITSIKLLTVAVCTILWAVGNGHTLADLRPIFANRVATAGLLYTGLVTTAFAIFLQSVVFKRVSSTDASIILTSEPIWAALFAVGKLSTINVGTAFLPPLPTFFLLSLVRCASGCSADRGADLAQ